MVSTIDVPELGVVEIRGLSPDELADLPIDAPSQEEVTARGARDTYDHAVHLAVIAAGCVHPRLSESQLLALSASSRKALCVGIIRAHPATRRLDDALRERRGTP